MLEMVCLPPLPLNMATLEAQGNMVSASTGAVQGKAQRACVAGRVPEEGRGTGWCVCYLRRSGRGGEGVWHGHGQGCCLCNDWFGLDGWFGFVSGLDIPGLWVVQELGRGGCGRGLWMVWLALGGWFGFVRVLVWILSGY